MGFNVRTPGDSTSHLAKNPHVGQSGGTSTEPFIEVPRFDALLNADLLTDVVAHEVVLARREGRPMPTFNQSSLKNAIKTRFLQFAIAGSREWFKGLDDADIEEVRKQAATAACSVIPELWDGRDDKPELPEPKVETTEIAAPAAAPPAEVVAHDPGDGLTVEGLSDLSRTDMIDALARRGVTVPKNIGGTKAKNKLLELLTPATEIA